MAGYKKTVWTEATSITPARLNNIENKLEAVDALTYGNHLRARLLQSRDVNGTLMGSFLANSERRPCYIQGGRTTTTTDYHERIWTSREIPNVEYGIWTPVPMVEGGSKLTATNSAGYYFVMGRMVTVVGRIMWTKLPSNTEGRLIVQGLPFANKGYAASVVLGAMNGVSLPELSDAMNIAAAIPGNASELRFFCNRSGRDASSFYVSNLLASGELHFTATYLAN